MSGPGVVGDDADATTQPDSDPADIAPVDAGKVCLTDFDCTHPGVAAGCDEPLCNEGICANTPTAKGVLCDVKGWIGGVCQEQECDGVGHCLAVWVADGSGCGDISCGEICQQGKCKAGASADDGNPCTTDSCNDGVISHEAVDDPTSECDDGDPCTEGDSCAYGKCSGGTAKCGDGVECTIDFCDPKVGCVSLPSQPMCEDGDPCTKHVCDAKTGCEGAGVAAGEPCDDGNPCTEGDSCGSAGICAGGANSCGCQVDSDCKANTPCLKLTCKAGKCVADPEQTVNCDDKDSGPCSVSACDAKTGECALKPVNDGKACGDDDPCTVSSVCAAGQCKAKTSLKCDDGNGCTVDICSAGVGCVYKGGEGPCEDGNACSTDDVCQAGVCAGKWKPCNDGDACTTDKCDAKTGACQHIKIAGCGGCAQASDCEDNNACTFEMCIDGKCSYQALNCDDGNSCTKDSCNAKTGGCAFEKNPGCVSSKCKTKADCDDKKVCTNDSCQLQTGKCYNTKVNGCTTGNPCKSNSQCADNNKCTSNLCIANKCAAKPINCDDYNPCTNDSCQSYTGNCYHAPIPGCVAAKCKKDGECDDQNNCTKDVCTYGWCTYVKQPDCAPQPGG